MLCSSMKSIRWAAPAVIFLFFLVPAASSESVPAPAQPAHAVGVGVDSTSIHHGREIVVTASRYDDAVQLSHTIISA